MWRLLFELKSVHVKHRHMSLLRSLLGAPLGVYVRLRAPIRALSTIHYRPYVDRVLQLDKLRRELTAHRYSPVVSCFDTLKKSMWPDLYEDRKVIKHVETAYTHVMASESLLKIMKTASADELFEYRGGVSGPNCYKIPNGFQSLLANYDHREYNYGLVFRTVHRMVNDGIVAYYDTFLETKLDDTMRSASMDITSAVQDKELAKKMLHIARSYYNKQRVYLEGDFAYVADYAYRTWLTNMYKTVSSMNLWFVVDGFVGGMEEPMSLHEIGLLRSHPVIVRDGHTSGTFGTCIRYMYRIKRDGWDTCVRHHIDEYIPRLRQTCPLCLIDGSAADIDDNHRMAIDVFEHSKCE